MQCVAYSYLNYTLINFRLSILSFAWSSLTANCLSLMEASSGFHSHWFILQTVLLVVINFITSLLFVATAAVQWSLLTSCWLPFQTPPLPLLYCHALTTPLPLERTCNTPPFWSQAHTYVKSLMLACCRLLVSNTWWRFKKRVGDELGQGERRR